jgi:hypothetical protein
VYVCMCVSAYMCACVCAYVVSSMNVQQCNYATEVHLETTKGRACVCLCVCVCLPHLEEHEAEAFGPHGFRIFWQAHREHRATVLEEVH